MKFCIVEKQKLIAKGYVITSQHFQPRESLDGTKVVIHSEFVKPLNIEVIAEYEYNDIDFLALMQNSEWQEEPIL